MKQSQYPDFKKSHTNPLYRTWCAMLHRCYGESSSSFMYYGAKGRTVSDKWKDSFYQFVIDMGPKPTPKHQLDRIDNSKPYSKKNCRWSTASENRSNRPPSKPYTHTSASDIELIKQMRLNGKTIPYLAQYFNRSPTTINRILHKLGIIMDLRRK